MPEDLELLHGSAEHLADLLGCSVRQARRYRAGTLPLPEPSRRLLKLLRNGDLSSLLGSAWAGFSFSRDGLLFVPGWANGMRPEQIRAMFYGYQEAAALKADLKRLRNELWAMKKLRQYPSAGRITLTRDRSHTPSAPD